MEPAARVLVAPDSFKGTFSAVAVAEAIARGCLRVGAVPDLCPLADGGEGTADVLRAVAGGSQVNVASEDALGRPVEAEFTILADGARAVVEVAAASGLGRLGPGELDPWAASTYGTGILIAAALERGVGRVLVAAGGSATVDGGRGAIAALRERGFESPSITVLCDVSTGWEHCARVFGPQKGADPALVAALAERLDEFAMTLPRDPRGVAGSGAAGGLAGGLWGAFGADLVGGADFILDAVGIADRLAVARCAISGEGRIDAQSSMGKVIGELGRRAERSGVPLHAIVGRDGREPGLDDGLASVIEAGAIPDIEEAGSVIAAALTANGDRLY
jgi:glycerate kinase